VDAQAAEPLHEAVEHVDRGPASDRARWSGVVEAWNTRAREESLQLGASSRVITRRAILAVSSTSNLGHAMPCLAENHCRKPTSNGAL
jgi:hypothetical protein